MAKHALAGPLLRMAMLWVAGCGRFGYELLPKPVDERDGGSDDASNPVIQADAALADGSLRGCDGSSCGCPECGCGVAVTDSDGDGTPDCVDECPADANKSRAGRCGCGVSEQDTDLDGIPDCADRCSGNDAPYTPDRSCGVGYCKDNNAASTCVMGLETACRAALPLASSDASCDGIDDDCDGAVDEDYASTSSSCGLGICAGTGMKSCVAGQEVSSCVDDPSKATSDDNCNGLDDDCNGLVDDKYPTTSTRCGVGRCVAMGARQCVEGTVVDSCTAMTPISITDATCDNVDDDCDGKVDEDYQPVATRCGVGACARTGTRTCVNGSLRDSCVAGTGSANDTRCNDVDDDCDGKVDEDYVVTNTSCGVGYCASTGQLTCVAGATQNSCTPRAPRTSTDDAFTPGNGIDDNCNGRVDEDVPACNTSTLTYEAGSYTIAVPGNCKSLTVRLWGGAGAAGQNAGASGAGGNGGAGGYASGSALVSGTIQLDVGSGGASGCNNAGTNPVAAYNGGAGGSGSGSAGADGTVAGGNGASPSSGAAGGRGYFGGGGGGQGNGGLGASGNGGGGGAASVLLVNGTRVALAGGGGGGGGAQALTLLGTLAESGGAGGGGCSGTGSTNGANGGGGGGGGTCQGSTVTRGTGVNPANGGSIPSGRAKGGSGSCVAGGNGYATVTFAP